VSADLWASEGLYQGDCREILRDLDEHSIDSGVLDPPYGIGFMGREWDTFAPGRESKLIVPNDQIDSDNPNLRGRSRAPASSPSAVEYDRTLAGQRLFQEWTASWAAELLRVLKPGAHAAVFGAPRSFHRMACGLEDAGFEVRDTGCWLFGQGFPKSKDLGDGVGTALKPGWEPIVIVRKPLGRLTTTAAHEMYGTGGINIDACRIGGVDAKYVENMEAGGSPIPDGGRWPGNVMLDEAAATLLDEAVGELTSGANPTRRGSPKFRNTYGEFQGQEVCVPARGADRGGPSRFFYCPKVSLREREFGCAHLPLRSAGEMTGGRAEGSAGLNNPRAGAGRGSGSHNAHPTVKPIALMRWLVKLITPPGGTVVDCFVGSGSTGIAAMLENRGFLGTDLEAEWLTVAQARIVAWRLAQQRGEVV